MPSSVEIFASDDEQSVSAGFLRLLSINARFLLTVAAAYASQTPPRRDNERRHRLRAVRKVERRARHCQRRSRQGDAQNRRARSETHRRLLDARRRSSNRGNPVATRRAFNRLLLAGYEQRIRGFDFRLILLLKSANLGGFASVRRQIACRRFLFQYKPADFTFYISCR